MKYYAEMQSILSKDSLSLSVSQLPGRDSFTKSKESEGGNSFLDMLDEVVGLGSAKLQVLYQERYKFVTDV